MLQLVTHVCWLKTINASLASFIFCVFRTKVLRQMIRHVSRHVPCLYTIFGLARTHKPVHPPSAGSVSHSHGSAGFSYCDISHKQKRFQGKTAQGWWSDLPPPLPKKNYSLRPQQLGAIRSQMKIAEGDTPFASIHLFMHLSTPPLLLCCMPTSPPILPLQQGEI